MKKVLVICEKSGIIRTVICQMSDDGAKSEARISKSETNSNIEIQMVKTGKQEGPHTKLRANLFRTGQACEDCEFSTAAVGAGELVFTCDRKKLGHRFIVKGGDYCEKFVRSRDLIEPHLAEALAEGAKLIPLTQGKFAIVDADDYEELGQYKWYALKRSNTYYAARKIRGKSTRMHRLILRAPKGLLVDHRNYNGLDNRKQNLRLCTRLENNCNRRPYGKTSRYKGVSWHKHAKKFMAYITFKTKRYFLGYYDDEVEAAKAYDKKAKELFGQFAYLNFPNEVRDA